MRYRRISTRHIRLMPLGEALSFDVVTALGRSGGLAPIRWRPPADVCETGSSIGVVMDLAGVGDDDVEITLFEDALVVEGERRVEGCGEDGRYHAAEIRQGRFHVQVALPVAVDADGVQATFERGLLRVTLPKARPVRIDPTVGTATDSPGRGNER